MSIDDIMVRGDLVVCKDDKYMSNTRANIGEFGLEVGNLLEVFGFSGEYVTFKKLSDGSCINILCTDLDRRFTKMTTMDDVKVDFIMAKLVQLTKLVEALTRDGGSR